MKKVLLIVAALFLMAIVLSPIGCETTPQGGGPEKMDGPQDGKGGPGAPEMTGPGGDKGGKKGKAPAPTHEEFVEMYDKDGDGEVSMKEFLGE